MRTVIHGFVDVSDGGGLYDVPDDELLDGLVLGDAARAVGTPDRRDMATPAFGSTSVPPLTSLQQTDHIYRLCYIRRLIFICLYGYMV